MWYWTYVQEGHAQHGTTKFHSTEHTYGVAVHLAESCTTYYGTTKRVASNTNASLLAAEDNNIS